MAKRAKKEIRDKHNYDRPIFMSHTIDGFGRRLKAARLVRGGKELSTEWASHCIGRETEAWEEWENGKDRRNLPSPDEMILIQEFLGVPILELLYGREELARARRLIEHRMTEGVSGLLTLDTDHEPTYAELEGKPKVKRRKAS